MPLSHKILDVCLLFFYCKKRLEYFDLLNHRTSTFVLETVSSTDILRISNCKWTLDTDFATFQTQIIGQSTMNMDFTKLKSYLHYLLHLDIDPLVRVDNSVMPLRLQGHTSSPNVALKFGTCQFNLIGNTNSKVFLFRFLPLYKQIVKLSVLFQMNW